MSTSIKRMATIKRVLALALATFVAAGASGDLASAADGDTYTLQNLATGKRLDSNVLGNVYALSPNGGANQRWKVFVSTFDTRVFKNVATGRCLDSNTSGSVYTLACNGGSFQKWIRYSQADGTRVWKNLATGKVLDSNSNGAVYTLGANGGSYQKWIVTQV